MHSSRSRWWGLTTLSKWHAVVAVLATVAVTLFSGGIPVVSQGTQSAQAAPVAAMPAGTGTSSDGRLSLTKTASTTSLPSAGGTVTYTYTVKNTHTYAMFYYGMSDDRCSNWGTLNGLSLATSGEYYLNPGETATATCTQKVTQTTTNTATADFYDYYGVDSIAQARATVTVASAATGNTSCDNIWYSTTDNTGKSNGHIGTVLPNTGTSLTIPTEYSDGAGSYNNSSALAIDPNNPNYAYYTARTPAVADTFDTALYRMDLTTGQVTEVTAAGLGPQWQTNRLAVAPDGTVWSWDLNGRLWSWNATAGLVNHGLIRNPANWTDGTAVSGLQSGDIVFDGTGTMWLLAATSGLSPRTYLLTIGPSQLAAATSTTGPQATLVGLMANAPSGGFFNGLAFKSDGTLYASASVPGSNGFRLYTVNKDTGAATAVTTSGGDGLTMSDLASCALPKPQLQVLKTNSPTGAVKAGDVITYTITVKNIGTVSDSGVTFTDAIPANTTYVAGSAKLNGTQINTSTAFPYATTREIHGSKTAFAGVIPAGDTATVTFQVKVNNPLDPSVTTITNQATVNDVLGTPIKSDDPTLPGGNDPTVNQVAVPGISVDKTASVTTVTGSGPVTYTYTVKNTGNEPLKGVTLTDDKCPNPSLQPANAANQTGDGDGDGLLDRNETWVYTCTQTLTYGTNASSWTNTATAKGTGNVSNTGVTATDTATVTIVPTPAALNVTKTAGTVSGPDSATGLYSVNYTVQVKNTGQTATTYGPLTDTPAFASNLQVTGASWSGQATGSGTGTGPFTLNPSTATSLAGGATHTYNVTLQFKYTNTTQAAACTGSAGSGLYNSVAVAQTETSTTDNAACVAPPAPPRVGIDLVKAAAAPTDTNGDGRIGAGDQVQYQFTLTNTGNVTLANPKVTDPMFPSPRYTASCVSTSLAPGATTNCAFVDTTTGTVSTHVLTQAEVDSGAVSNTATGTGTPPAPLTPPTDTGTTTTPLTGTPAINLVKKAATPTDVNGNGVTDAGDTIAYTFTVTNTGSVTLTNVKVTDAKVGAVTCPVTTLAPGASTTCTAAAYTITAADQASGSVNNTATATGTPPSGTPPTSTSQTTTPVVTPANLTIAKTGVTTSSVNAATGLATTTYTITVRNTGGAPTTYALTDTPAFAPGTVINRASWSGKSSGTANGSGPYTFAPTGTSIAAGATHTYNVTLTYHFTQTTPVAACTGAPGNGLYNAATLDNGASDDGCINPPTPLTTGIELTKTQSGWDDADADGLHSPGDRLTYTFVVRNTGTAQLTGVTVSDPKVGTVTCPSTTLAAGGTLTCTAAPYTVTAADLTAGSVDNTATVVGTPPPGLPQVTDNSSTTTPIEKAGITLDKQHGPIVDANGSGMDDVGDTVAYTFTVTNTGTTTLAPVTISDARLGLTNAPCVASLAPGETATCSTTPTYTATAVDIENGYFTNTATATGTPPNGGTPVQGTDTTTVIGTPKPQFDFVKKSSQITDKNGNGLADAGDTIAYTFTVTNTGNATLTSVTIDDPTLGLSGYVCSTDELLQGESATCTPTTGYTITAADVNAGSVNNTATATVTTHPDITPPGPKDSSTTTPLDAVAGLQLVKSGSAPADTNGNGRIDVGDTITYTFSVTNIGTTTLAPVKISDAKLGLTNAACADTLAAGATATCTTTASYPLTQADVDAKQVVNTATATGIDPDGKPVTATDDNTVTYDPAPSIELVKGNNPVTDPDKNGLGAGDQITYTFTVTNTGPTSLHSITITDPKLGLTNMFCNAGPLAPGASVTCASTRAYTLTQADVDAGKVDNTATVRGLDPSNTPTTDPDDHTVPLVPTAAVALAKSGAFVNATDPKVGDPVQFVFTVTNKGGTTLTHLVIDDNLLGLSDFVCSEGPLAPGASVTCNAPSTHALTQAEMDAGVVHNDAQVTGTPATPGVNPPTAPASADVPVPATNALSMTKTASAITDADGNGPDAGDTIAYTFTVTNDGEQTLSNVTVTDAKLGLTGAACVATLAPGATATCTAQPVYTLTQADVNAGAVDNTATTTGTAPNGDTPVAQDQTHTPMTNVAAITLDKSVATVDGVAGGTAKLGSKVVYQFTVTNTSNVTLTNVAITDAKLALNGYTCTDTTLEARQATTCLSPEYTVTQADVDAKQVANTATVTGTDPKGTKVTDDGTAVEPIAQNPAISLDKQALGVDPGPDGKYSVGDIATYHFVVTNTGDTTLGDVYIDDARLQLSHQFCANGPVAPGASVDCYMQFPIEQYDIDEGVVNNTAYASSVPVGGDPNNPVVAQDSATVSGANTNTIDLQKVAGGVVDANGDNKVSVGDTITYTFTVTNTGSQTLHHFTIDDATLGLTGWVCTEGPVAPGESFTCQPTDPYVLTQAAIDAGTVDNHAIANALAPLPEFNPPAATDDTSTPLDQVAAITLDKSFATYTDNVGQTYVDASGVTVTNVTGPSTGDTVDYTFTVTNTSNVTLTNVGINDTKLGLTGFTCAKTTLAPGEKVTCTSPEYTLTQADVDARRVDNTASVTGTDPKGTPVTSTDSETVTAAPTPAIDLTKNVVSFTDADGDGKVDAGGSIVYSFSVTNTGAKTLRNVVIDDAKLGISGFLCASTLEVGHTATCQYAAPYQVSQEDSDAGNVHNVATATGTAPSGAKVTHQDTQDVPVDQTSAFTLVKSASALDNVDGSMAADGKTPTATPGDQITYTFTVKNTGSVTLRTFLLSDSTLGLQDYLCVPGPVAPGETGQCTVAPYPITDFDIDNGQVDNIATMTADPPSGAPTPPEQRDEVTVPLDQNPALTMTKSVATINGATPTAGQTVNVGDSITYAFEVTNTGNVTLNDLKVTDDKLGTTFACGTTRTITIDGVPTQVTQANLAPGASLTCTSAAYTVTQADVNAGVVHNTATASGTPPNSGTDVTTPPSSADVPTGQNPAITVDKELTAVNGAAVPADPNPTVKTGDTLTYSFVVTNTGTVTLTDVNVTDAKIAGVTCPDTTLDPGQQTTCTVDYTVTTTDADAGRVVNTATAHGTPPTTPTTPNPTPVDSTPDTETTPVDTTPGLGLVKSVATVNGAAATAGQTVTLGDQMTWSFAVTNTGAVTLSAVNVVDPTLAAKGVTINACAQTTLAPGASTTCTTTAYTVTQADVDAGAVYNQAVAHGTTPSTPGPDGTTVPGTDTPSNPSETFTPTDSKAVWTLAKTGDTPVDVNKNGTVDAGDTIAYHFTVTNTGTVTLYDVAINDAKLGLTAFVCGDTTAGLAVGASVTCDAPAVYTITQGDVDAGLGVLNIADAGAHGPTPTPVGTNTPVITTPSPTPTATASQPVAQTASWTLDKVADKTSVNKVGDQVTYTFVVKNTGTVTITNVRIDDARLAAAGVAVTCPDTTLAPGASTTCTSAAYTVTQADVDAGSVTNTATANADVPSGVTPPTPPTDTVDVPVTPAPAMALVKSVATVNGAAATAGQTVKLGDSMAWSYQVTNNGNQTMTNVRVDDAMLAAAGVAVTCPQTTLAPGATVTCTSGAYTVTQADVDGGAVYNVATAKGTGPTPPGGTTPPETTTPPSETFTPTDSKAVWTLTKTGQVTTDTNTNGVVDAGDVVTYTFTVANTGTVTLTDVVINDTKLGLTAYACGTGSLLPGASRTCTATDKPYTITQADMNALGVLNIATAGATGPTPTPSGTNTPVVTTPSPTPSATHTQPVDAKASWTLDKISDVTTAGKVGDQVRYSFVVKNTGTVTMTNLSISDPKLAAAGVAITCPDTTLAPGASTTCTAAPYTLTQADVDAGKVVNTATANADVPPGVTPPTPPTDTVDVPVTPAPGLAMVKSVATINGVLPAAGQKAALGDTMTWSYAVTNTGNQTMSNVAVDDPMLAAAGVQVTCPTTTLAPGATVTCTSGAYTVTQANVDAGAVYNVATAKGTGPTPPGGTTPPDTTTPPSGTFTPTDSKAVWTLEKTGKVTDVNGNGVSDAGDTIVYTFTVKNTGTVTLTDVVINDAKLGLTAYACGTGSLAPGATRTCAATDKPYTITQQDVDAGLGVLNIANAGADGPTPTPVVSGSTTITPTVSTPSPTPTATHSEPVDAKASWTVDKIADQIELGSVGQTVNYTFVVKNTGTVTINNVRIDDPMLAAAKVEIICPQTTLAPRASTTCTAAPYTLTQADLDAHRVLNTATANADVPPGMTPPTPPNDTVKIPTVDTPDLTLVKSVATVNGKPATAGQVVKLGDPMTWSYRVFNTGNVTMTNISVDDKMLAGLETPVSVTCPKGPVAPGQYVDCTSGEYTVTQANVDGGAVYNLATAKGTEPATPENPTPPVVTSPPSETFTPTDSKAVWTLEKDGTVTDVNGNGVTDAGDTIAYHFTVTNTGTVTLYDVVINDAKLKLAGLVCGDTVKGLVVGATVECDAPAPYTITQQDVDAGLGVLNIANAGAEGPSPSPSGTNTPVITTPSPTPTATHSEPVDAKASWTIDKKADVDLVYTAGEKIRYSFVVTNTGTVTLTNVRIDDSKLKGVILGVTCLVTTLAPGASTTCTANAPYTVTDKDVLSGSVVNTATANADVPPGITPPEPPTDTVDVPVAKPGLDLVKTVKSVDGKPLADGQKLRLGDEVVWTFHVANTGNVTMKYVMVEDARLAGLGVQVTCPATTLAAGATMDCTSGAYTVTQADVDAGSVSNAATVEGTPPPTPQDPTPPKTVTPPSGTETPTEQVAAITLDKQGARADVEPGSALIAGQKIAYAFTVKNTGTVTLSKVTIDDAKLALSGFACSDEPLTPGEQVTCTAPTPYTVTDADVTAGTVDNTATATGQPPAGITPPKATDKVTVPGESKPAIGIVKHVKTVNGAAGHDGQTVHVGDRVVYSFDVTNTGNVTLDEVGVTDTKVASVSCPKAELAPGESMQCLSTAYTVTSADQAAGKVVNVATAHGRAPHGGIVVDSTPSRVEIIVTGSSVGGPEAGSGSDGPAPTTGSGSNGPFPGLAYTGAQVAALLAGGVAALGLGTGLVLVGRRRRDDEDEQA